MLTPESHTRQLQLQLEFWQQVLKKVKFGADFECYSRAQKIAFLSSPVCAKPFIPPQQIVLTPSLWKVWKTTSLSEALYCFPEAPSLWKARIITSLLEAISREINHRFFRGFRRVALCPKFDNTSLCRR